MRSWPHWLIAEVHTCAGMQAMNELSGINVTSYYFAYVLINAIGVSTQMVRILACISSVEYDFFVWMVRSEA